MIFLLILIHLIVREKREENVRLDSRLVEMHRPVAVQVEAAGVVETVDLVVIVAVDEAAPCERVRVEKRLIVGPLRPGDFRAVRP